MGLREHLEEQIAGDLKLLKQYQDELRYEADPALKGKLKARIKELKQRVHEHEEELKSLSASSVQPEPVTPYSSLPATPSPEPEQEVQPSAPISEEEPQEDITTPRRTRSLEGRRPFLKWAVLGGATSLVTAMVARRIFPPSPKPIPPQSFNFEVVTVNSQGTITNRSSNEAEFFKEDLGNSVILEMVSIPGGKFLMGTEDEEIERLVEKYDKKWWFRGEQFQHEVIVQPFFMGKYPVTQAQWKAIASLPKVNCDLESDPSYFKGDNRPVESVSWDDAVEFCKRLSNKTGRKYRLPSEAEWEYACRAGTTTPFHFGETITTDLANYNGNSTYASAPKGKYRQETTSVRQFPHPNAFGLYDMHGNVWEWCEDKWHKNYKGAPTDGIPWLSGASDRIVVRGGSWDHNPVYCRSAYRNGFTCDFRDKKLGFRVVCVASRTT